jgi:hypothetical protein
LGVPLSGVAGTDFELKRSGHPIHSFEAIVFLILAVRMEIDEPGRDNQTCSKNSRATTHAFFADGFDSSVADTDIAD